MIASVNGLRLFYAEHGEGAPVLLLHGFPETHRSWDLQLPALAQAGYRAITPDLRGYGQTEAPKRGYDLDTLSRDVAELIEHAGAGKVSLVGHDWGGAVAWHVATRYPEKLDRLIVIDCPHPVLMARALRSNLRQLRRSWYMFFFQLPELPERLLAARGGARLRSIFHEHPRPASIVDATAQALSQPGALRGPLAYYRTMFRRGIPDLVRGRFEEGYRPIELPVTVIWGDEDEALGTELIDGTERFAPDLEVHIVKGAGHFVHQERPDEVNALLLAALARPRAS
ncbi:MAG: alpha/beta hydrolase [Sorangiineae bacterium]|nr:alpha/beta hydrolase [Polyangiaceae bacterium]MEB2324331.1 alpha/beta hydrolase [Sorangiineae bacterium]